MASLAKALEIIQAARDAFEGIGGTGVLLDDEPLAAGSLGSGEDFRDVQVSMADLCEEALTIGRDRVIFHMQQRKATSEPTAGFGWITASGLHPMDIEFGLKVLRRGAGEKIIQHGAAIVLEKLVGMIVITQFHARAAQHAASCIESGNQIFHMIGVREINSIRPRIGCMSDSQFPQAINDLLGIFQNHLR